MLRVESKDVVMKKLAEGCRDELKMQVVFSVMTTDNAEGLFESIPYRMYMDFVAYYQLYSNDEEHGESYVRIDNEIAQKMGISEQELYSLAVENTEKLIEKEIIEVQQVDPLGMFKMENVTMEMIIGSKGTNGAAFVMFPNIFKQISEEWDADILFSICTTQEIMVFKADERRMYRMLDASRGMAEQFEFAPDELMTGSVYLYKHSTGEIELALDAKEEYK